VNVSTPTVAPEPFRSGAAPAAEPWHDYTPRTPRDFIAVRAATTDMDAWYAHVAPAAACSRPVRLVGHRLSIEAATGRLLSSVDTDRMPDGTIYKACGDRRTSVCPACAKVYQRDAYQLLRAGLVGGKGVPETVSAHPASFLTVTAPSFGPVHTRVVAKHTCAKRSRCDCRPNPCRARTGTNDPQTCKHGAPAVCFARHEPADLRLGRPLCLDCYDHEHHVVWNAFSGELWRRTKQKAERHLAKLAEDRGIPPVLIGWTDEDEPILVPPVRISHGKAAEYQRRGVVHFHALTRLDGVAKLDADAIVPPPAGFTYTDLDAALHAAVAHTAFNTPEHPDRTPEHPDRADGWPMAWGEQVDVRPVALTGTTVTDQMVAGYLAKYATKSTEVTGHRSVRITGETIADYANPDGDHIARLIEACWVLGRPQYTPVPMTERTIRRKATNLGQPWTCPDCGRRTRLTACLVCYPSRQAALDSKYHGGKPDSRNKYARLRRWAHMLGFGGHFLTKGHHYSVSFAVLRAARIDFHRAETNPEADPVVRTADHTDEETTLIVGALTFAGIGWHNTGDALLANTSAALARARREAARDELAHRAGSAVAAR